MIIKINRIYGWIPKLDQTIQDILDNKLSHSDGPIIVSKLDTPPRCFYMIDGYHRVLEAIQRKEMTIECEICVDISHIQRTGGAYNTVLEQKTQILLYPLIERLNAPTNRSISLSQLIKEPQNVVDN